MRDGEGESTRSRRSNGRVGSGMRMSEGKRSQSGRDGQNNFSSLRIRDVVGEFHLLDLFLLDPFGAQSVRSSMTSATMYTVRGRRAVVAPVISRITSATHSFPYASPLMVTIGLKLETMEGVGDIRVHWGEGNLFEQNVKIKVFVGKSSCVSLDMITRFVATMLGTYCTRSFQ